MDKIDEDEWSQGLYNYRAFSTALAEFGAGLSGKHSKAKYLEKPFRQTWEENQLREKHTRKEYAHLTEEEKQKAELEKAVNYFNSLKARF